MDRKQGSNTELFTPISLDTICVLFFKTPPAIDPVDFVHRICEEIVSNPKIRKMKYINRLTPMTAINRATEKGLEDVSKSVLGKYFRLNLPEGMENGEGEGYQDQQTNETLQDQVKYSVSPDHLDGCLLIITYPGEHISVLPATQSGKHSRLDQLTCIQYAIRPTIRNHNTLKRNAVIDQIASSIADTHTVDLTNPDKVIIVDIYKVRLIPTKLICPSRLHDRAVLRYIICMFIY